MTIFETEVSDSETIQEVAADVFDTVRRFNIPLRFVYRGATLTAHSSSTAESIVEEYYELGGR